MKQNLVRRELYEVTQNLRRAFTRELAEINLSYPQWNALKALKNSIEPLSAKDLVEELNSDKATISGVINRLKEAGYIEVKQNPVDRRATLISLKHDSVNLCSQVLDLEDTFNAQVFENFSEEEISEFSQLLSKLKF